MIEHLRDLKPDPRNARRHNPRNVGMLTDALHEVGAARSIVIDETGTVLAGNATIEAAADAGIERVQVVDADGETLIAVRRSGLSDEQKRRLALYDNRVAELAEWDADALLAEMQAGVSLDGLFREEELAELIDALQPQPPQGDPDEIPETPVEPVTKRGDIITLGRHRLMCGDATSAEDMSRLTMGRRADLIFTDPPYNCADDMQVEFYANTDSPAMRSLSTSEWDQGFDIVPALAVLSPYRPKDGTAYICTSHHLAPDIWSWMKDEKPTHSSYCVWCKPNPMPSLAKRHPTWGTELICYATWGKHTFNFPQHGHALNWWEMPSRSASREHPTMKPVELVSRAILYSSKEGDKILDPFGGSGTTLIAAEQEGRTAYLMEIDPHYCDVIIERYQRYTGQTVERAA